MTVNYIQQYGLPSNEVHIRIFFRL